MAAMRFRRYSGIATQLFGLECWMAVSGGTEYSIWKIPVDDLGPETYRVNKSRISPHGPLDQLSMVGDKYSFSSAVELAEQDATGALQREEAVHE